MKDWIARKIRDQIQMLPRQFITERHQSSKFSGVEILAEFLVDLLSYHGLNVVWGSSREVLIGLSDNNIVAKWAIVGERARFGDGSSGETILIHASIGQTSDVQIKVTLIQNPDTELAIWVWTDVPLDKGVVIHWQRVAAENSLFLVMQSHLGVPWAGWELSRVVNRSRHRTEAWVWWGPSGTWLRWRAQVASSIDTSTARGSKRWRSETSGSRVSTPKANWCWLNHERTEQKFIRKQKIFVHRRLWSKVIMDESFSED